MTYIAPYIDLYNDPDYLVHDMGNSIYTLTILHPMIELFLEIKIYEWPKFGV